jgi:hypothetical protein
VKRLLRIEVTNFVTSGRFLRVGSTSRISREQNQQWRSLQPWSCTASRAVDCDAVACGATAVAWRPVADLLTQRCPWGCCSVCPRPLHCGSVKMWFPVCLLAFGRWKRQSQNKNLMTWTVALTVGFISMASLCGELADTLPSGMMSFGQLP